MRLLFIGAINLSNSPKGGEEYKNQLILEKLVQTITSKIVAIDAYNWKRKPLLIAKLFLNLAFKQYDSIVISASSVSTYLLLKIITKIKPSILDKSHYLVTGRYFLEGVFLKRYDWKIYQSLKSVVVEGEMLKEQLLNCSELENIQVIPNFKMFESKLSFKEKKSNIFKFLFIGRISRGK